MPGNGTLFLARVCVYGGALVSTASALTLIAFFLAGQPWGTYNDFSYGILAILFLPLPFILRQGRRPQAPKLGGVGSIVGVVSLVGLSAASFLLTASEIGLIRFQSPGPLAIQGVFFLLFEAWLILLGAALKSAGMANAMKMSLIAITIAGLPVWAVWLARQRIIWAEPA